MTEATLPTPCYLVDEALMKHNLNVLKGVMERTGCRILLAQKCFSMFSLYPLIGQYLCGTTASGLYEAKLARKYMGNREVHIFSPAYEPSEIDEILRTCDHVVFNSFHQWTMYKKKALAAGVTCGLRINPQCSTQQGHAIYDPCGPGSRLGVTKENFQPELLEGISGLHFHTLCEQGSGDLKTTLLSVEKQFGAYFGQLKWLNFGGGHHITKTDYDMETLEWCIRHVQETYGLQVYLEPGEAVALDAGTLITTVLDTLHNGMDIAILDASAACHMPDVLEMPYRPRITGAGERGEKAFSYRLGGNTCLAGDVIGDYSFDAPLQPGDRLSFEDMAIYTMVKNNTFNGMRLPSIAIRRESGQIDLVRSFGYDDFEMRLS